MPLSLQQRLLRMLSAGISSPADVEDLVAGDWAHLLVMARQQQLGPLLHWRIGASASLVPKPFAEALASSYQKHTLRSVEVRAEMSRVQRIMRENEIPAVFLKGAYLAFHVYPRAALRPLRNLDLLVPEFDAAGSRVDRLDRVLAPGRGGQVGARLLAAAESHQTLPSGP